jgi:hypothetical protein
MTAEVFKSDLEIHKAPPEKGGYYLRSRVKGMLCWHLNGDDMVIHLQKHYAGQIALVYCDFETESYGMALGSEEEPRVIEWHHRTKQ